MFPVRARASGELEFTWIDDLGTVIRAAAPIEVV
jgi:hypothetical protein